MKKNMRNALAISGMAIVLGTSGIVLDANAKTINDGGLRHERGLKGKNVLKNDLLQRHRKGLSGTVASIKSDSLDITKGTKTFTVSNTTTTRVFNKAWKSINFSDIQTTDKLVVHGTLTGTNFSARTIRDLSL